MKKLLILILLGAFIQTANAGEPHKKEERPYKLKCEYIRHLPPPEVKRCENEEAICYIFGSGEVHCKFK